MMTCLLHQQSAQSVLVSLWVVQKYLQTVKGEDYEAFHECWSCLSHERVELSLFFLFFFLFWSELGTVAALQDNDVLGWRRD